MWKEILENCFIINDHWGKQGLGEETKLGKMCVCVCVSRYMRAICKVCGLTPYYSKLEIRGVVILFRSTSLGKWCTSYNTPLTPRKHAADYWALWNFLPWSSLFMVGKAQKSHGVRSELNSAFSLEEVDQWNPTRMSAIQSRFRPLQFLGFSNHKKWALRQEISKWSMLCSTFLRSGWSAVRSVFAKGEGTSKKRLSPHLYIVLTWSNKVSPWTLQMTLV
jgi:hypothetical protein